MAPADLFVSQVDFPPTERASWEILLETVGASQIKFAVVIRMPIVPVVSVPADQREESSDQYDICFQCTSLFHKRDGHRCQSTRGYTAPQTVTKPDPGAHITLPDCAGGMQFRRRPDGSYPSCTRHGLEAEREPWPSWPGPTGWAHRKLSFES